MELYIQHSNLVEKVLTYIGENLSEPMNLEQIAERFFVSKYYLFDNFNFQLGGQFEYLLGAKEKVSGQSSRSIRNDFNRYNISFIAGLAYDFDFGLVVEGRYFYGLTQLTPLADNSRSGYLQLSLGYRFW